MVYDAIQIGSNFLTCGYNPNARPITILVLFIMSLKLSLHAAAAAQWKY